MPRSNIVCALLKRIVFETPEFYAPVAEYVGIRSDAAGIRISHLFHHHALVIVRQVNFAERNAERDSNSHGIHPVLGPRALREFRLPNLDEYAYDVKALLFEK